MDSYDGNQFVTKMINRGVPLEIFMDNLGETLWTEYLEEIFQG